MRPSHASLKMVRGEGVGRHTQTPQPHVVRGQAEAGEAGLGEGTVHTCQGLGLTLDVPLPLSVPRFPHLCLGLLVLTPRGLGQMEHYLSRAAVLPARFLGPPGCSGPLASRHPHTVRTGRPPLLFSVPRFPHGQNE